MRHIKTTISFIIFITLITSYNCFATIDTTNNITIKKDNICFSEQDAARLVVEIEKGKIYKQNLDILEKINNELTKQNGLLKEQIQIKNDELEASNQLIKKTEELNNIKTKALEEQLKEASKTRWGSLFGAAGLGAAAFGLILLLVP